MGARAAVLRAVAAVGARGANLRGGARATGARFDALIEVLGPLCGYIPEPQYSWLLLCGGQPYRLRTVSNALHDRALALYPRSNADRLYTLCQIVAADCSRGEAVRIPLHPQVREQMARDGEPVPTPDVWGGSRVARQLGITEAAYYAHWRHKREALEDILSAWDDAWGAAAERLRAHGVLD